MSTGWLNSNELRSYPFWTGPSSDETLDPGLLNDADEPLALDNRWIVDAAFTLSERTGYDPTLHSVQLVGVYRGNGETVFEFRVDTPECQCVAFQFIVPDDAPRYSAITAVATQSACVELSRRSDPFGRVSLDHDPTTQTPAPAWYGFGTIVIGNIETLYTLSRNSGWFTTIRPFLLEPGVIAAPTGNSVLSVEIANVRGVQISDPCADEKLVVPSPNEAISSGHVFTGSVDLKPGFNADVRVSPLNLVEIQALLGYGEGKPCELIGNYPASEDDEEPDPSGVSGYGYAYGYIDLTSCADTILSINGIRPDAEGRFPMFGRGGVRIDEFPETNTLVVHGDSGRLACEEAAHPPPPPCEQPTADAGPNLNICSGDVAELAGAAISASTTLWSTSGDGTFDDASILTPVYTPGTLDVLNGTVTLSLTAFAVAPCENAVATMTLSIVPPPTADAGANQSVCVGERATLSPSVSFAASVRWSTSGDGTFVDRFTEQTEYVPGAADIVAGSVTLSLVAFGQATCADASDTLTLTIVAAPTVSAGTDQTICATQTATLAGSASNATMVLWATSGDGTFSSTTTLNPTYTPGANDRTLGSVVLTLAAFGNSPCGVVMDSMTLTLRAFPSVNAGADQNVCSSSTVAVSGTALNAVSVHWTTSGTGSFANANAASTTYTPSVSDIAAGSITLTLTATGNSPCGNAADSLAVTFVLAPGVYAGPDQPVCGGSSATLAGVAVHAASSLWTTSGDGTFLDDSSPTTTYTPGAADLVAGSVTLMLTVTGNSPCGNAQDSVLLTFVSTASANAGVDQTVCQGAIVSIAGAATNASSVTWSTSGDGSFGNTAQLSTTYTPGATDISNGSVTLTLTAHGSGSCSDAVDSLVVTILSAPLVNAGIDQTICAGATASVNGSATGQASVQWSTSGTGTFVSGTQLSAVYTPSAGDIAAGTVTLTLHANGTPPCGNSQDSLTLTITAAPTANAGTDQVICAGSTANLSGSAAHYASTLWSSSGSGSFANPSALSTVYTPSAADRAAGVVTLTLRANGNSPCGFVADSKLLTILAQPTANAGADKSVCAGGAASVTGAASNYSAVLWTSGGDGSFDTPDQLNASYTPGATDISNGSVVLTLTVIGNSPCGSTADTMTLTIVPAPTSNAGVDQTICSGSTVSVSGTATHAASTVWTSSGSGTFANNSLASTTYTPSAADRAAGTVTLTLIVTGTSPCISAADSLVVTIRPTASVDAGTDQSKCAGAVVSLAGSASNYSSVLWSTSGDGSFGNTASLATTYTPGTTDISNGSVTLTLTANGVSPCPSVQDSMIVAITAAPTVNAGVDQSICAGSGVSLSGSATHYAGALWRTSGSGIFANPANLSTLYTPSVTDLVAGSVTLTLTASGNAPCGDVNDSMVVTFVAAPTLDVAREIGVCGTDPFQLSATASNYTSVEWTTQGDGTFDDKTILTPIYAPGAVDLDAREVALKVTVVGNLPCGEAASDVIVSFLESPIIDAGIDQSICSNGVATVDGIAEGFSSTSWSTSGDGSFGDATQLSTTYTPGPGDKTAGSATLTLSGIGTPPCEDASDALVLTIVSAPTAAAGADQSVCSDSDVTLNGVATNAASTAWSTSGDGTFDDASQLAATYTPGAGDLATGSVTLTLTSTGNSPCGAAVDSMIVTFIAAPSANAGADDSMCTSGSAELNGSAANYASVVWSTSGDGTFDDATQLNTTYTPGAGDIVAGTVLLTLTATGNSPCSAAVSSATWTLVDAPTAEIGIDQSICSGQTASVSGTATHSTGVLWSTSGTGSFANANASSTTYTPSAADIAAGSVTLTFSADGNAPCATASDSTILTIVPAPTSNAGVDQSINSGQQATLSGSATHASGTLWSTSGDGTFGNATQLSTTYTPGSADIAAGLVTLTLTANGNTPCSAAVDTLQLTILTVTSGPFTAGELELQLDSSGRVQYLRDLVTGVTRLPSLTTYMCQVYRSGQFYNPTAFSRSNNTLTFTYGGLSPAPVVTIDVVIDPTRGLEFHVTNVTNQSVVDSIRYCNFNGLASVVSSSAFTFTEYNDGGTPRVLGLISLDIHSLTQAGPSWLLASAAKNSFYWPSPIPLIGRAAFLFACAPTRSAVWDLLEPVLVRNNFPFGVTAKRAAAVDRSEVFWWGVGASDVQSLLPAMQKMNTGRCLLLHLVWSDDLNGWNLNTSVWSTQANFNAWVSSVQTAGIAVGLHAYPSTISKFSNVFVSAGLDSRLYSDYQTTLAAALSSGNTAGPISLAAAPTGWPVAGDPSYKRIVAVDSEAIAYGDTQISPPALLGPLTRAYGNQSLGAQSHSVGAPVKHLGSNTGQRYVWTISGGGVEMWVGRMATVSDAANIDFIYADDAEVAENAVIGHLDQLWHGANVHQETVSRLLGPTFIESSTIIHWGLPAVVGQTDYSWSAGFKSEVRRNLYTYQASTNFRFQKLQLGWAHVSNPNPADMTQTGEHTTCDEIEFLANRGLAADQPISWYINATHAAYWPNRISNQTLIGEYETLRRSGYFSQPTKDTILANQTTDYFLFKDGSTWYLQSVGVLSIGGSSEVKGYLTTATVNGKHWVSLWPVAVGAAVTITLALASTTDIAVFDHDRNPILVSQPQSGQVQFLAAGRVYIRLDNVSNPTSTFSAAVVVDPVPSQISGTVTNYLGVPQAGVSVIAYTTGGGTISTLTDANGNYALVVTMGWSGSVSCDVDHVFYPSSSDYVNVLTPQTANFVVARRRYVAVTGSNSNPGTFIQPYRTPQFSIGTAAPGDVIEVMGGTYFPIGTGTGGAVKNADLTIDAVPTNSGVLGYPITMRGMPGQTAILTGRNSSLVKTADYVVSLNCSYFNFENFEVEGGRSCGVWIHGAGAHHITVRNCWAHHCDVLNNTRGGFFLQGTVHDCDIIDCVSNNNPLGFRGKDNGPGGHDLTGAQASTPPIDGNIDQVNGGTYDFGGSGNLMPEAQWDAWIGWISFAPLRCRYINCMAFDNTVAGGNSDGLNFRYATDCVIEDCISYGNGDDGIDLVGCTRCVVRRCISFHHIAHDIGIPLGNENGFKAGVRGGLDHVLHHNISFENNRGSFSLDNSERSHLYHNIGFRCKREHGFFVGPTYARIGGADWRNNISYEDAQTKVGGTGFACGTVFNPVLQTGDHFVAMDYNILLEAPGNNATSHVVPAGPNDIKIQRVGDLFGPPQYQVFDNPDVQIDKNIPAGLTTVEKINFIRNQVVAKFALAPASPAIDHSTPIVPFSIGGILHDINSDAAYAAGNWNHPSGRLGAAPDCGALEHA